MKIHNLPNKTGFLKKGEHWGMKTSEENLEYFTPKEATLFIL